VEVRGFGVEGVGFGVDNGGSEMWGVRSGLRIGASGIVE
jgi:hypothetical protein